MLPLERRSMKYKEHEWLITVHKNRQDKVLWSRTVVSDEELGMALLGMFKLASAILKGYIRCAKATKAYPELNNRVYEYLLTQDTGFGRVKGGYHVERRGAFEVRITELKERIC